VCSVVRPVLSMVVCGLSGGGLRFSDLPVFLLHGDQGCWYCNTVVIRGRLLGFKGGERGLCSCGEEASPSPLAKESGSAVSPLIGFGVKPRPPKGFSHSAVFVESVPVLTREYHTQSDALNCYPK